MEGLYDDNYEIHGGEVSGNAHGKGNTEQVLKLDLWDDCILPTTSDALDQLIIPVVVGNVVLKLIHALVFLHKRDSPRSKPYGTDSCTIPAILIGIVLLYNHMHETRHLFWVFLVVSLLGSALVVFATRHPNENSPLNDVWKFCGLLIMMNEIASLRYSSHNVKLRPHLMLLLMKLISICDDIERRESKFRRRQKSRSNRKRKKNSDDDGDHDSDYEDIDDDVDEDMGKPSPTDDYLAVLSYVYHPASILLGSWHPSFHYTVADTTWNSSFRTLLQVVANMSFSIVSLTLSNCLIQFVAVNLVEEHILFHMYDFLPNNLSVVIHQLTISYLVALQFRTSHYFIAKLTQASFVFWGNKTPTTNPWIVENPRSLVDVVVNWNIPIHMWLKKYVFKPAKKQAIHSFFPIISTYVISSFLHGLNFQIWSVLLTLGCLTYLEFKIREKLVAIYDSCILSRACEVSASGSCLQGHKNEYLLLNWFINGVFRVCAILHLTYLGSTFDGKEDSSRFISVIYVWAQLGFLSHWLGLLGLVVYLILPAV